MKHPTNNIIYSIEDAIISQIVEPLEQLFTGEIESVNWIEVESSTQTFCCIPENAIKVHEALHNLYLEYLRGGINDSQKMSRLKTFVYNMICKYNKLGEWVGSLDIMEIADGLLTSKEPAHIFFKDMRLLLRHNYAPYISSWDKTRIEEEIERLAVQDDRKRAELFCVVQAYYSIATNTALSDDERMDMYDLLLNNWQYLVNIYSVMVKRIVGSGFKNFLQLVNNVNVLQSSHPYIHLFYNAILLRQDDIFPTDSVKDKAVKNMTRMEDIMKESPRHSLLDNLCTVLFGKEFEEVMQRKKPLSYDEMKQQLKDYRDAMNTMEQNWMMVVNQLKAAVEASVPISTIEKELLKMEPNIAISIFSQLNMLLTGEDVWTKNANEIKEKLLEKRDINISKANIHVAMVKKLENNGTINDLDGAYILADSQGSTGRKIALNNKMLQ